MSSVRILAETPDTVTVSRADWLRLLQELEDAEDRAAVRERRTREELLGKDAARRDYLTAAEARRLIDGESPVRIWREKRGLSQREIGARRDSQQQLSGRDRNRAEAGKRRGSPATRSSASGARRRPRVPCGQREPVI